MLGHSVRTVKEALDARRRRPRRADRAARRAAGRRRRGARRRARRRRSAGWSPPAARRLVEPAGRRRPRNASCDPGPIAEMLEPEPQGRRRRPARRAGAGVGRLGARPAGPSAPLAGLGRRRRRRWSRAGTSSPATPNASPTRGARLLDARVALHRVTGGRSDQLPLQDQDAVARLVGARRRRRARAHARRSGARGRVDHPRPVGAAARGRGRPRNRRPGATATSATASRCATGASRSIPTRRSTRRACCVLRRAARSTGCQFEREHAQSHRSSSTTSSGRPRAATRSSRCSRAGRSAIGVFETLDHVGLLVRLLPEWEHVRARPQRNAYHRFTVDRHSLEAVAECAALLDPAEPVGQGLDGDVARRARADVLLLAALLHDIGKGRPGDHSDVGAETRTRGRGAHRARRRRHRRRSCGSCSNHLLLADTATRRDLNDELTITRFARRGRRPRPARRCCTRSRSATRARPDRRRGAPNKAALVRELWAKTDALLEEGARRRRRRSTQQPRRVAGR